MRLRDAAVGLVLIGLVGLAGCGNDPPPPATAPASTFRGVKIAVGAVGDPALIKSVTSQRGEWQGASGGEVEVRPEPVDPKALQGIDVLLFPGDRLGDLVDLGALAVLPDEAVRPRPRPEMEEGPGPDEGTPEPPPDPLAYDDIIKPAYADQVTRYGQDRMGLPYGGSALVLVYRRDAMESEANRKAAREAGLALEVPRTWDQLDALAKFFHGRDWDGDGSPESGIALAWGPDAEGVGVATYLARASALGQHRDQFSFLFDADSMEPRITLEPFVFALRDLVALKATGPAKAETFDAEAARAAFRSGEVAFLIDRAERASRWADAKVARKIGVAALPGSKRVYEPEARRWEEPSSPNRASYLPHGGGWLVGVVAAATGPRREAAVDFAKYLAGPDTSNRTRADRAFPMAPTRTSQLAAGLPDPRSAPGVDARQWSQAVAGTLTAPRVVPGLRIPHADAYVADLDTARVAAVGGEPADRALGAAAKSWSERTKALGTARQLWHYRRSLNSLATAPEPPAR